MDPRPRWTPGTRALVAADGRRPPAVRGVSRPALLPASPGASDPAGRRQGRSAADDAAELVQRGGGRRPAGAGAGGQPTARIQIPDDTRT